MERDFFLVRAKGFKGPGGFIDVDWVGEGALRMHAKLSGLGIIEREKIWGGKYVYYGCLPLYAGSEAGFRNDDVTVSAADVGGDGDGDVEVADCLGPFVGELGLFRGFFGAGFGVFFLAFLRSRGSGHCCCGK